MANEILLRRNLPRDGKYRRLWHRGKRLNFHVAAPVTTGGMQMRGLILAIALALATAFAYPAEAQDLASSIVGTWKLTSFARKDVATGKTAATYGEHPPGYAYYTKGGRFQIFVVSQDRKKNEKPEPTDAERIELFKSMFSWGGTYKTEANKIVYNVDIAWVQSWIGTTRTYQAELAGSKLTVTTPTFKSTLDGQDVVVVTTYERVE